MNEMRREEIWEALSDVFVDNEVDYGRIAERTNDIDPAQLEEIFFSEVAPVCGSNLMTPVPPEWIGFDREDLAKMIREMQTRCKVSITVRLWHKCLVRFYRWNFRDFWKSIAIELKKRPQST